MLAGLALGLAAALLTGIAQTAMAGASRRLGTTMTSALVLVASLLWFLPLLGTVRFPAAGPWWSEVILVGALNGIAFLLSVAALRRGPLSVVGPISATGSVVTVVLAWALLDETLPRVALVSVPLVGLGAVLCATIRDGPAAGAPVAGGPGPPERRTIASGAPLMACAVLLIALFTVLLQAPVREAGWEPTVLVARAVSVSLVLGAALAGRVGRSRAPDASPAPGAGLRWPVVLGAAAGIGLLLTVSQILVAASLDLAPAWLVGATTGLSPGIVALAGVVVFGERIRPHQALGIVAIGVGVAVLTAQVALAWDTG